MTDAHLETVLQFLMFHTDDNAYIDEITAYVVNQEPTRHASTLECLLTVEKLVKDGYVSDIINPVIVLQDTVLTHLGLRFFSAQG